MHKTVRHIFQHFCLLSCQHSPARQTVEPEVALNSVIILTSLVSKCPVNTSYLDPPVRISLSHEVSAEESKYMDEMPQDGITHEASTVILQCPFPYSGLSSQHLTVWLTTMRSEYFIQSCWQHYTFNVTSIQ